MNIQDFKAQVESSSNILLVLPHLADADAIATASMMYLILTKKDKNVTIAASKSINPKFEDIFKLSDIDSKEIISEIKPVSYVISTSDVKDNVDVTWTKKDDKLDVVLTPESGEVDFEKISFSKAGGIYDLVIVINVSDLKDLGAVYTNHEKMYEGYNILSLGSEIENLVSLSDSNYSTTSEVLFKNLQDFDVEIDKTFAEIAAHGIIGSTEGLHRVKDVRTYGVISEIANRHEVDVPAIIRKYFYSMDRNDAKVRERVLKNLKFDDSRKVVYSVLATSDLSQLGVSIKDIDPANYIPFNVNGKYDYGFIALENGLMTEVLIYSTKPSTDLHAVISRAKGLMNKTSGLIRVNSNAIDAATRILNVISGGTLEDKVVVKEEIKEPVQPKPVEQKQVETPTPVSVNSTSSVNTSISTQPITQSPASMQVNTTNSPQVNPSTISQSSPFTKASDYVVDTNAEPMKKSNYFSTQDKPFDATQG